MTLGQILYSIFKANLDNQNVQSDDWDDLEDFDRIAWEATAKAIDFEPNDEQLETYGRPQ